MATQPLKNQSGEGPHKTPSINTASTETAEVIPRFLLVKSTEDGMENFSNMSPFLIMKQMYGLIGETHLIKKVKDGLLVQTKTEKQSRRLIEVTRFAGKLVKVEAHPTLNISKGVVYCRDLLNCTLEEIAEELRSSGVIQVKRLKTKIEGTFMDTPNHVLTFNSPSLPSNINVAFYKLKVRPYIPPPVRCFNCQLFGHVAEKCQSIKICACGQPPHEPPCSDNKKCVNCQGPHSAGYKNCPTYKVESAIQKVKTVEKLTYSEAKKKVMVTTPKPNISYSAAASSRQDKTEDIFREILPRLEILIRNTIIANLNTQKANYEFLQPVRPRSESVSTVQSSTSKRGLDQMDSTSEDETKDTKKTKGWPKGKPRK